MYLERAHSAFLTTLVVVVSCVQIIIQALISVGIDIPDYVTVRSRERPSHFREEIIKRFSIFSLKDLF